MEDVLFVFLFVSQFLQGICISRAIAIPMFIQLNLTIIAFTAILPDYPFSIHHFANCGMPEE